MQRITITPQSFSYNEDTGCQCDHTVWCEHKSNARLFHLTFDMSSKAAMLKTWEKACTVLSLTSQTLLPLFFIDGLLVEDANKPGYFFHQKETTACKERVIIRLEVKAQSEREAYELLDATRRAFAERHAWTSDPTFNYEQMPELARERDLRKSNYPNYKKRTSKTTKTNSELAKVVCIAFVVSLLLAHLLQPELRREVSQAVIQYEMINQSSGTNFLTDDGRLVVHMINQSSGTN